MACGGVGFSPRLAAVLETDSIAVSGGEVGGAIQDFVLCMRWRRRDLLVVILAGFYCRGCKSPAVVGVRYCCDGAGALVGGQCLDYNRSNASRTSFKPLLEHSEPGAF